MELFYTGIPRRLLTIASLFGVIALSIGPLGLDSGAWRAIQLLFGFCFVAGYVACVIGWLYVSLKNRHQPT